MLNFARMNWMKVCVRKMGSFGGAFSRRTIRGVNVVGGMSIISDLWVEYQRC